jgi:Protein of Unknown function (DUF2784)
MRIYAYLADSVVFIHLLWILFLIFGAFWGVRNKAVKVVHILGLISAFIVNLFDIYCPLTLLETWLKSRYSPSGAYTGSFIAHYMEKIIYINLPDYAIFLLTAALCAFNAWVYFKPLLFFHGKEK